MLHYKGVNKWKSQPQSHHKKEHLEEARPKPSFHQQVNSSLGHDKLFGDCDEFNKSKSKHRTTPEKNNNLEEELDKHTRPSLSDGKLAFGCAKSNSTVYQ
jgi:hypothetical protein